MKKPAARKKASTNTVTKSVVSVSNNVRDKDPDRIPTVELTEDAPDAQTGPSAEAVETPQTPQTPQPQKKGRNPANVHDFIVTTLTKGIQGLVADFRGEKRTNDLKKMKAFVENQPEGRNRYKDVGCLDNNRVDLKLGPVHYIHANYVAGHSNPKKFICTQAPLPKTIADFWYMVVQEKCQYILMLCNHKEQGANKCAEYYPRSVKKGISHEDVSVTAVRTSRWKFRYKSDIVICRTELDVIVPGKKPHRCTHLHWRDWPDRGVPPTDLAPIELCGRLKDFSKKSKAPIIVHCSAGIGRTGSIVLIDLLLEMQNANIAWDADLLRYLRELRAQRNNSVQTEHQYLYVHMVVLNFIINHQSLGNTPEVMKKMEKFTEDYNKYCKGF